MAFAETILLGYIGPETILPVGSALAAAGGVLLMFWNRLRKASRWLLRAVKK